MGVHDERRPLPLRSAVILLAIIIGSVLLVAAGVLALALARAGAIADEIAADMLRRYRQHEADDQPDDDVCS
jgi:hypothetical protein